MSDAFWGALFGAIPASIIAYAALRATFAVRADIKQVRKQTDGLATALANSEGQRGIQQGRAEGIEIERQRMTPNNGA